MAAAPTQPDRVLRRRRLRLGGLAVAALALGLLLWARLILVTGHPRTAIATPDPDKAPPAPAPVAADR